MGKDSTKSLFKNSITRLYSPWQSDDNETLVRKLHISKEDEFEACIDDKMTRTILRIEQEQLERMEHLREEDSVDDGFISKQAQKLNIHSSSSAAANQPFTIPLSDHALSGALSVPQEQHKSLITLKEAILSKEASQKDQTLPASNPQVIQIYKKIGCSLARLQSTHSRLPKALKIIPSLSNWDEILFLTNPSSWTPQATYEVTRLFVCNVKATQTKQYLQLVLLHAVRDNLAHNAHNQLDPALYYALKKALTRNPALFIKGLLFPLCESNSCSVTEACILASVLGQAKIPALQSATVLLRLSEQEFSLPISILIQVFLAKRQPLPYRVIDILTFQYFCQREKAFNQLPWIWYQSLQIFAQSYSVDMVPTQKKALLALIQSVSRNDEISFAIEKSIKSAIKSNDQEFEADDSDATVVCNQDSDDTVVYYQDTDMMLID